MQIIEPVETGMVGGDDDTEAEPSNSSLLHIDELSTRMCLHLLNSCSVENSLFLKNDEINLRNIYRCSVLKFIYQEAHVAERFCNF